MIKKYLPVLQVDDTLSHILDTPVKYVASRACTIGNRVYPSLFPKNQEKNSSWLAPKGFFIGGHGRCCACNFATVTKILE